MIDPKIIDLLLSSDPANNELGRTVGNSIYNGQLAQLFDEWAWKELYQALIPALQLINECLLKDETGAKKGYFCKTKNGEIFPFIDINNGRIAICVKRRFRRITYHRQMDVPITDPQCRSFYLYSKAPMISDHFTLLDQSLEAIPESICALIYGFYHLKKNIKFVP